MIFGTIEQYFWVFSVITPLNGNIWQFKFRVEIGEGSHAGRTECWKNFNQSKFEPFLLAKCLSHKIEVNINSKIRILNKALVIFTTFIYRGGDS